MLVEWLLEVEGVDLSGGDGGYLRGSNVKVKLEVGVVMRKIKEVKKVVVIVELGN